jgi:hypothetical protein
MWWIAKMDEESVVERKRASVVFEVYNIYRWERR